MKVTYLILFFWMDLFHIRTAASASMAPDLPWKFFLQLCLWIAIFSVYCCSVIDFFFILASKWEHYMQKFDNTSQSKTKPVSISKNIQHQYGRDALESSMIHHMTPLNPGCRGHLALCPLQQSAEKQAPHFLLIMTFKGKNVLSNIILNVIVFFPYQRLGGNGSSCSGIAIISCTCLQCN